MRYDIASDNWTTLAPAPYASRYAGVQYFAGDPVATDDIMFIFSAVMVNNIFGNMTLFTTNLLAS
jgi:hypothetical protein